MKQFFEKYFVVVVSVVIVVGAIVVFLTEINRTLALERGSVYKIKEQISSEALQEVKEESEQEATVNEEAKVEQSVNTETEETAVEEVVEVTPEPVVTSEPQPEPQPTVEENTTGDFSISPYASDFKSYMDYRAITNTSSTQYKMQQEAYTDENGLRKIGEHFCVAMGTYYGNLGDILYVETDKGASWTVILSDVKSDAHTDSTHRYTVSNHCMMEFIIDTRAMSTSVKRSGTINSLGFQGKICYIEKIR